MQTTGDNTVPLSKFKRTKMLATVGPSTNSYEDILAMLKGGANGIRLNFSHGTHEERTEQLKWIRKASEEYKKPVAIVADLQGPKIRCGDFEGMISIERGQEVELGYKHDEESVIPIQYDLAKKVKRGERIYLSDGKIKGVINGVSDGIVRFSAQNSGILTKRKGINLPDTDFAGEILTTKDKKDIAYISEQDVDYVALSFVQHADDVKLLKRLLKNRGSDAKVIAKIETHAAIENIEGIVEESDAVMVARGDLATETLAEAVPVLQRKIIGLARKHHKISIVATQMLASMTETPEPTRAEVSDVATAVIVGADCVMLSDETASGQYPLEAIDVMKRIILYTQENSPLRPVFHDENMASSKDEAIADAIITLSSRIGAKAIVAATSSGHTALSIAAKRPSIPLISVTSNARSSQQLAIAFGCKSFVRPDTTTATQRLTDWLRERKVFKKGDVIVTASGKYPGIIGGTDTIKVRVLDE